MDAREAVGRTIRQNKALHVYFELVAEELNNAGLYIANVIRADAPWNKDRVKELIWKTTQEKMLGKRSTKELTTGEIDKVYDVVNRALSDKGIHVEFPHTI